MKAMLPTKLMMMMLCQPWSIAQAPSFVFSQVILDKLHSFNKLYIGDSIPYLVGFKRCHGLLEHVLYNFMVLTLPYSTTNFDENYQGLEIFIRELFCNFFAFL